MNPQSYELWYEHFSGVIRLNPRWDDYDRTMMAAFRLAKLLRRPLNLLEFGFTPKVAEWSRARCFTMQMQWMAENVGAKAMAVVSDKTQVTRCSKDFPKLFVMAPTDETVCDWFNTIFPDRFIPQEADLVMVGGSIPGLYDWCRLKPGTLVAFDEESSLGGDDLPPGRFERIVNGELRVYRRLVSSSLPPT